MVTKEANEAFYTYYFWTAAIVFIVVFILMLFLVIPTLRTKEEDKPIWKKRWNHIEIVMLVTWMVAVMTAIPDAASSFSQFFVRHNQTVAEKRLEEASKFASQIADHRCNPPIRGVEGVCLLIREFMATKVIDAEVLANLSNAFTKELEVAESAGLERDWERIAVMNLANYAREVSGFAMTRDRIASMNVTLPLPEWLLIFWPHLIAFGFALSLAKAIASYSLL